MKFALLAGLGGALGTMLRYGVNLAMVRVYPAFPAGTLLVNILGSFLLGFIAWVFYVFNWNDQYKIFLLVGVLGGFTTFSSFSYEVISLFRTGEVKTAIFYILISNGGGIIAALTGFLLARLLLAKISL